MIAKRKKPPVYRDQIPTVMGTIANRMETPNIVLVWQRSGNERVTYSCWRKHEGVMQTPAFIQGQTMNQTAFNDFVNSIMEGGMI